MSQHSRVMTLYKTVYNFWLSSVKYTIHILPMNSSYYILGRNTQVVTHTSATN